MQIPYAPTARWFAILFSHGNQKFSDQENFSLANREAGISTRDFARCHIADPHGKPLLLSIAVEGGARQLRNHACGSLPLSDHGNWRKTHPGALEAAYGRAPFFDYLFDRLLTVYEDRKLSSLDEFNRAVCKCLSEMLFSNISGSSLNNLYGGNVVLLERGEEIASQICQQLSVIDALMKFGPETLLALPVLATRNYDQ